MSEIQYQVKDEIQVPNIIMEEEKIPTGKYAIMRMEYLRNHKKAEYSIMRMEKELAKHLTEIQDKATKMINQIVEEMTKKDGITEELKATNQMEWVGIMNNYQKTAEQQVVRELIYI